MMFASSLAIFSIMLAASCTSVGVKSSHQVTANIMFFAHSSFASSKGFSMACLVAFIVLFSHSPYHIPNKAVPEFLIITDISAKSIFIKPGLIIKSDMPFTQRWSILSIISNACLNVVFLSIILNILSFGITIRVSTVSLSLLNHSIAFCNLLFHSKLKGLVTTHTVSIQSSLATCAITGVAQVQVPPHIQAVIKSISVSSSSFLMSSALSSAAFLQISKFAPAPSHLVIFKPIFIFLGARLFSSACASVFTLINPTHSIHSCIILFIVFPQAQPAQITLILAQGMNSGVISFIAILYIIYNLKYFFNKVFY